jgi:hypothetical protein
VATIYVAPVCPELRAKVLVGLPGRREDPADADAVTELEVGSILAEVCGTIVKLVNP